MEMGDFMLWDWFVFLITICLRSLIKSARYPMEEYTPISIICMHIYIQFLGDGRDTAPRSVTKYVQELIDFTKKIEYGEITTVISWYYAMDRGKRWERI